MATPFDYLKAVSQDIDNRLGTDELPLKDMNRFLLIRGMMIHHDTIHVADIANKLTTVPDEVIFKLMHTMISPKRPRYGKFPKQMKPADKKEIDDLMEKYELSSKHARDALELCHLQNDQN